MSAISCSCGDSRPHIVKRQQRCLMGNWVFWLRGKDIVAKDARGRVFEDTASMAFFDPRETVTLCPEPAPEPRRLTFAEAVAEAAEREVTVTDFDHPVATWDKYSIVAGESGGHVVARGGEVWSYVPVTPAMLAAEWVAK